MSVRFLRSCLSGIFFFLYGSVSLLFAGIIPVLALVPGSLNRLIILCYKMFVGLAHITGLFRVTVHGDLSKVRGKIVVMNHLSLIDVVILMSKLPDSTCIVKEAASKNFFYSKIVNSMFLLATEDPVKTLKRVKGLIEKGTNLIIFPEGTRIPASAKEHKLQRGAARLALESGADILPIHQRLVPAILAKGQPWWDVGDKIIRYDLYVKDVIEVKGEANHKNAARLTAEIAERILHRDVAFPKVNVI